MFPLGKCSFQSHLSRCAALVGCECSPPCHSAAHTGKGGSATEEGIGKASNSPDMCCGIFTSAESSSHRFVCAWRHAQALPMGQIPNVFERVSMSSGFLLSVCGPFRTGSFLRGDKGQFKIFRCTM